MGQPEVETTRRRSSLARPPGREDRFRILVVDDEQTQLELVGGFLRKAGFEVVLMQSAGKALQIFREEPFDLVLTDQRMPELSGLDLLNSMRGANPEVAIIVVTAYGPRRQEYRLWSSCSRCALHRSFLFRERRHRRRERGANPRP